MEFKMHKTLEAITCHTCGKAELKESSFCSDATLEQYVCSDCHDEGTQADGFWKEPTVDSRNFPKRLTEREELEEQHGQVWNTKELQQDFTVQGFASPCVVVIRKSDKTKGTLEFIHQPRFYFDFVAG
tara:strand:- start:594 stop:977 length:384 start_codon:yes stop_codon:yes gene_type:complete